jgi:glycosyltransferase involved in cell wall biosynthesis/tetratricopeptide (TPR) repeat protein
VVVSWEGSFLDHGSLSQVNRGLIGQLKMISDCKITCVTNGAPLAADAANIWPELAREMASQPAPGASVTVRHAWPPNWKRPATGKLAVIQPWEFGSLPQEWVRQARDVDEFWVPSNYVRNVYLESGVPAKKVFVVPNGVEAQQFHPEAAPMKLATVKKFKFLFVGGTIGRKGPDLLLQAYLKNFTAADDVCLVIKDFGGKSVYTGQTLEAQIRALQSQPNVPEILYLNEELPPEMLPGLYTACDCFVLPYRGEGFGLPVLEAMACGLPVIVTAGGATDDFVRDEFAYRIPAAKRELGREVSGLKLVSAGWLLEPSLAVLGEKMRHVFNQPGEARERGRLACREAHQFWSWKNAAGFAAQRIRELGANQNVVVPANAAAQPAPVKLAAVAEVGRLDEARELFDRKNFAAAWAAALTAMANRPFHPEAFLLLAEIALAAGSGKTARLCAQRARDLAPGWQAAKQFLTKPLKGDAKLDWLDASRITHHASRLSVCLIVKNEEKFLAQCLKSVRGFASQIVVVDTGSTDRTVEIAREFGAEIYSFAWCDDFAAARNAALEHANGDWILMLDADEELPAAQHAKLQADMNNANAIAFRLPLVNAGQENEGRSFIPRLFRNAPEVFFRGRIHEQVFTSLLVHAKKWGLKTALGSAEILHHGYTKEMVRDRNKVERNLKLLRAAVVENPADVNLVMNLGLELVRSDDLIGGIEKYREAFDMMSAQPADEVVPELREVLLTQFTSQLYKVRGHEEVLQVLNSPLARRGGLTASLHFALGLAHFELKQFREAADQMRQCLAKRKQPGLTPINTDILTAAPSHCLALSLAKLGDPSGAEKAFAAALAETGHAETAKLDFAKFLQEQSRSLDALHQLHEIVATNARNVAAWRLGGEIALPKPEYLEFARDWTGEAFRALPENPVIAAQRAEALMLNGDPAAAAGLWEKIWRSEPDPRALAALVLCEAFGAQPTHAPNAGPDEEATSRAFIEWYQKLIAARAHALCGTINERLEPLSRVLPTAAQMLETALSEAAAPAQVCAGA